MLFGASAHKPTDGPITVESTPVSLNTYRVGSKDKLAAGRIYLTNFRGRVR